MTFRVLNYYYFVFLICSLLSIYSHYHAVIILILISNQMSIIYCFFIYQKFNYMRNILYWSWSKIKDEMNLSANHLKTCMLYMCLVKIEVRMYKNLEIKRELSSVNLFSFYLNERWWTYTDVCVCARACTSWTIEDRNNKLSISVRVSSLRTHD